jgi:hypothetical protein
MRLAATSAALAAVATLFTLALVYLVRPAHATDPSVSLKQPRQNEVLSSWYGIRVNPVADDAVVQRVDYFVDGTLIGTGTDAPYFSFPWYSPRVADGQHTLYATAHDAAGRAFSSPVVTFVEQSSSPPPPTTTTTSTTTTTTTTTATTTTPTTTTEPPAAPSSCPRPYAGSSPWNTPVAADPVVHANSAWYVSSITQALTSDPTQYTYPVYYADGSSPLHAVKLSGRYSNVTGETTMELESHPTVSVPIPATAAASAGSDAQLVILDPSTGDAWGSWQLSKDSSGAFSATNGYHYNTAWSGVPPRGFGSRGAGVPYLAGLVRPCEIAQGHIDHAIAFAYNTPTGSLVWPATKSDGTGTLANELPEGARLQLDPSLTTTQLAALGVTGPALVVAKALQTYGMYVIDVSGRPKLYFEYDGTAGWNGLITAKTVRAIPVSRLRWVNAG